MKKFYKILFLIFIFNFLVLGEQIFKTVKVTPPQKQGDLYKREKTLSLEGINIRCVENVKSLEDKVNPNYLASGINVYIGNFVAYRGLWTSLIKEKKSINPFEVILHNIYVAENNKERVLIEAIWKTEEYIFSEKIIKYKNLSDWIFVKIESTLPFNKNSVTLLGTAFGSSYGSFNKIVFNKSGDFSLPEKEENLPKTQPGDYAFCYYNMVTKDMNSKATKKFFVFSEKYFDTLTIHPYTGGRIIITTKPNMKEIIFAVKVHFDRSDLSDEYQKKIIDEFLYKKAEEIKNKLESINWKVNYEGIPDIKNILDEIDRFSNHPAMKIFLVENDFIELKKELQEAIKIEDYRKIIDIGEKLIEMREKMYDVLVEDLKK